MFGTELTPAFPAEPDAPKRDYAPNPLSVRHRRRHRTVVAGHRSVARCQAVL
jgi:hypothetical protein